MFYLLYALRGIGADYIADWLLADHTWNDNGYWRDNATWQDT